MKTFSFILCTLLSFSMAQGQLTDQSVLLIVGKDTTTRGDFYKNYTKNSVLNKQVRPNKDDLTNYLDLYINFRLKVQAAIDAGYDTNTALQEELYTYRAQLAEPYLTDHQVSEALLKEAYSNMLYDVRARHILISLYKDAKVQDTLTAYNKAMQARNELLKGADFAKTALKYSAELNRVKNQKQYKETGNEGDLGYFTAFSMVYPFEKAVYAMKVGDISMPIRTQYGYHIIQLTDKKPALGSIKAAHILVPITVFDTTPEQKSACRAKIDEAYAKLQSGTSFEEVAKEYSKDNASSKGGYLGEFTVNRMIPEFIEAFYKMKPGEYSKPIQTRFGWHILQFISNSSIESYLAVLPNLEYNISKDERSTLPIKVYASKLMKNNNLKENTAVLFSFQALIKDTILKAGHWVYDSLSNPKIYSQVLFSYGNNKVYLSDFARYMEEKQQQTLKGKAQIIGEMYGEFKISYSLQNEAKMLDSKYPEFKALMKEYRDGVYLFDINNRKVWAKASNDTVALRKYFEDHKDQYKWPHKVDAVVVSYDVKTVSTDQMRKCMEKAYKKSWSVEQIRAQMDKSFGIDVIKVEENTFEPGSNIFVDNTPWVLGLSKDILSGDTRKAFVIIEKIIPESYKDFSEIKGLVISDYQNYLDQQWIKELHKTYKVTVNKDVFESLFQ